MRLHRLASWTVFAGLCLGLSPRADAQPNVTIANPVPLSEGSGGGTKNMTFTVTRSFAPGVAMTVNWATLGTGTALPAPIGPNPQDFVPNSGSVSWIATDNTLIKTFNVQVVKDDLDELDETIDVRISYGSGIYTINGGLTPAATMNATGTITDNDSPKAQGLGCQQSQATQASARNHRRLPSPEG